MRKIRIGINGVGRIGKNVIRVVQDQFRERVCVSAVNDIATVREIADILQRDSVYGCFPVPVLENHGAIKIGDDSVAVYSERDANNIPWGKHNTDIVFECSRFYLSTEKSKAHLAAGAKRVIISAPCRDATKTIVIGVNHQTLLPEDLIISNASCTTNCYAPLTQAIDMSFRILGGLMSTTHAATSDQKIADTFGGNKNRAALNNIIPVKTGAATAVGRVLPHLNGKLNATGLRVPVDTGSVVEAVYQIEGEHSAEEIGGAIKQNAEKINSSAPTGRIIYYGDYYRCSQDCVGEPYSAMVSDNILTVTGCDSTLVKASAFYDNEMGFCYRMIDLALVLAEVSG